MCFCSAGIDRVFEPLIADLLDVLLHEAIVVAPADAGGADRRLLGPGGDLMSMQVMQVELIDQRLLDLLMQDEKAVGVDLAPAEFHRLGHVPIDIDRLSVLAVAGQIGDVVGAIELLDPAHDGVERAIEHQARDEPFGDPELLVRGLRVTKVERHRVVSVAFFQALRIIGRKAPI